VSARVVIEDPSPWLSADGFSDLGQVRHPTAVGLVSFGIEQSQDSDINAVTITSRSNNRFNVLPPGRCDGHCWQATEQAAVGCHQHQFCSSGLDHAAGLSHFPTMGLTE
jgi:hypothetical protein